MSRQLPQGFIDLLSSYGRPDLTNPLLSALSDTEASISVRLNRRKNITFAIDGERVPWLADSGMYLDTRPNFALDPAWHQGLYYVQDASSMAMTAAVREVVERFFDNKPLRYLDACAGFVPFAIGVNWVLDRIPGMNKLEIDAEGLKKKFGVLGEPLFLGVIVGVGIGCLTCKSWGEIVDKIPYILGLGIKMGAVMELIPRVTVLFIEGLKPISDATRSLIARKFKGADGLSIGMSPALVIGHPATLVASILLIPVTLLLAVVLPGNQFLPLASLAGMFYLFPLVLPYTKGNVVKTFIVGLVVLTIGLYLVTNIAPAFTLAAHDVFEATGDAAVAIPAGFEGGALDFASSPLAWVIYQCSCNLKWVGAGILIAITLVMTIWNRILIIRNQKAMIAKNSDELQKTE